MKRLGASFGSREPRELDPPPSLINLITLITYLFSFLLFVCLACPCASLYLRTLALTTLPARVLAYQHTLFCLFYFTLLSHQSFYFVYHQSFSSLLLPWVLSPTFHFCLSLTTLFTFLTSFSHLASLPAYAFCMWPLPLP
jgi:hypothetical protein